MIDLKSLQSRASGKRKAHKRLFRKLARQDDRTTDEMFHAAHTNAFSRIDCLECANCCKTTSPLFTQRDIERLASHLKMTPGLFIERYLQEDEEGDMVLQSVPCPFLAEDNRCSVYEMRPKACREFPHTNRRKQSQISRLTLKNASICPAVYEILEEIESRIRKPV